MRSISTPPRGLRWAATARAQDVGLDVPSIYNDPHTRRVEYYNLPGHNFGLTAAVVIFNRCDRDLVFSTCTYEKLPAGGCAVAGATNGAAMLACWGEVGRQIRQVASLGASCRLAFGFLARLFSEDSSDQILLRFACAFSYVIDRALRFRAVIVGDKFESSS